MGRLYPESRQRSLARRVLLELIALRLGKGRGYNASSFRTATQHSLDHSRISVSELIPYVCRRLTADRLYQLIESYS